MARLRRGKACHTTWRGLSLQSRKEGSVHAHSQIEGAESCYPEQENLRMTKRGVVNANDMM